MSETDKDRPSIHEELRGSIDTDPAAYRRKRFAQMLAGEPTWIARGDSPTSDVYNYYRHSERVAYVVDEGGTISAAETIDDYDHPLPLPANITLEGTVNVIEFLHELDEQRKAD